MQEKTNNVPKLRFPGFTDPWEQRKVSDITVFHKQGFYTTEKYGEDKRYYLLRGTDLTQNKLVLKETPKIDATEKDYQAFKIQVGDFLIVRSGTVGTYGIVYDDIPAIFGSYLIDFRFDKSVVTNEFFGYFYQSDLFKNQLRQIVQQSANTNINAENIKSTFILLPSLVEQKRIGVFLERLDNTITLYQRKLDLIKNYKKGMLQKMFPKDGKTVPEIRFPGFADPWEQRKFGEILIEFSNKSKSENEYPVLSSTNTGMEFREGRVSGTSNVGYKIINNDDLVLSPQNLWLGNININDIGTGIVSPSYRTFKLRDVETDFLRPQIRSTYLMNEYYNASVQGASVVRRNLDIDKFNDIRILAPSLSEQMAIGCVFKNLDNLITLHQRKLDQMKEYKKGLLQQMFV